jgi:hypothetical protein
VRLARPGPGHPYRRYGQEPITAAAIADLGRFADHRDLDAGTLFRATDPALPGVSTGPYVSQFLLAPYTTRPARQRPPSSSASRRVRPRCSP